MAEADCRAKCANMRNVAKTLMWTARRRQGGGENIK